MKSSNGHAIFPILFLLSFPLVAIAQPTVWTVPSLVRVGINDAAGAGTQASISAAKGEYESFQIAIQGPVGGVNNVNATVSDLTGPGGATIAKSNFTLFREHYVYVSQSSPNWNGSNRPLGAGWYADALIPFTDPSSGQAIQGAQIRAVPFNLAAATNQPIWVDLFVPRTAVAGNYTGTYTISSNQGNVTGNIALTVWNFTLPLESSLKSAFLLYNSPGLASDQELLRNKISPLHTDPSIQSSLISNFGLSLVGLPYFSGANFSNCTMSAPPSVSDLEAFAATEQPSLSRFIYSADEVNLCPSLFPTVKQWGQNLHQAGIKNLVTMAPDASLFDDGTGSGRSAVDIWTMLPFTYDQAGSLNSAALAKGDSLWSYNALVQDAYSPKWMIDFSPANYRIQPGFISQSLGLTGMLYWKADSWSTDPWFQVNNTGAYSTGNYPGEGMLVYPGSQVGIAGVAPSMRLKWLRDGVEDYEYVQMLKAAGQGASALQQAATVGANWSSWSQDPNQILGVRSQLGRQLDQLAGSPAPPTSTTTTTTTTTGGPVAVTGPSTTSPAGGSGCANTLLVNFIEPSIWGAIRTGGAQAIQVKIMDNCGTALNAGNGGTAVVAFSNGDATLTLQDWGNGIWNGTWTPVTAATQTTLTVSATLGAASGKSQEVVTVQLASHITTVTAVLNSASGAQAKPGVLAPGSYISIFGANLAGSGAQVASSVPLPGSLNGAQVFLGQKPVPLVYAGPGQINAIVPLGYDPSATYSLVVVSGGYSSTPVPVSIARVQPAIYTNDASGSGQGAVYIVGTSSLASASGSGARPALQGEFLTVYCNGLGPVSGTAPADGAATPSSPILNTAGTVTATIGGVPAAVQFAGLAPGLVGVYQVNVKVPAGLSGDAVPLILTETDPPSGQAFVSNTVTVALR